jgi:HAE1 family hydrophobic/amphiphilic exporter-1
MQKLAEVCIKRPIFAAMIVLALVVVGAAAYFPTGCRPVPLRRPTTMRILLCYQELLRRRIETQVSQRIRRR